MNKYFYNEVWKFLFKRCFKYSLGLDYIKYFPSIEIIQWHCNNWKNWAIISNFLTV